MNSLENKRILIFQQRGWGLRIGNFLANKLQREGAKLAAFTFKRTAHNFTTSQTDVKYDLIINYDPILSDPKKYLDGDDYSLAEICSQLGIDSIWPYVYTSREHVKSYNDKYYFSFRQGASDAVINNYIKAIYKCIKIFFDEFNPEVIFAPNFVTLPHIMFYFYAKKRGVKMIAVSDSKVKDFNIFVRSFNEDEGYFFEYLEKLNSAEKVSSSIDKARNYIEEFRENFKKPTESEVIEKIQTRKSIIKQIKFHLKPYYQIYQWYTGKPAKMETLGVTVNYRPPKIILRDHFKSLTNQRFTENFDYYPLNKVKKYIYFPLQFQPEETIDVIAPYFSNQIETARQVAMSLPDDYTLVVKEHPAMVGLRPPSYLKKIARTANVKLIDYRIPSETVLKGADLVVSPSSTTVSEAAFYRVPSIQLGNLGATLRLPNVFKHTDMTTLSKKINELLGKNLNTQEYERKLENFVAAAYDTGFNLNYFGLWDRAESADMDALWRVWSEEIKRSLS